MITFIDNVDTGKTKKLMMECSKTNDILVCKRPDRMLEKCRAYGINLIRVSGFEEVHQLVESGIKFYIDDLDRYLDLFPNELDLIWPYLLGFSLDANSKYVSYIKKKLEDR